jgi:hypothetical protein
MQNGRQYGHQAPVYATVAAAKTHGCTPCCPDRPARVQVEQKRALQTVEHAGDYNIWYGKYMGENNFERAPRASTRVLLETDAGLTRADYTGTAAHICLHFARGDCIYGKDCTYRHCAPVAEDETQSDAPHDIFGRTRHGSFRDDMGGTGTWNKECKTLYVGRLCGKVSEPEMTEIVARHFGEFGPLDSVRVLTGKSCAFITYRMRCSAEFAKEAMAEQALDHDEQINVRWAYDDPNPKAQAVRLRNSAQMVLAAMESKGHLQPPIEGAYPEELLGASESEGPDDPYGSSAKRQRLSLSEHATAPMSREEHEARKAEAELRLAEEAQATEAHEAFLAAQAVEAEAVSNASRLDAILSKLGGDQAPSGSAVGDDPLAEFLNSVDGAKPAESTGGAIGAASTATGPARAGNGPAAASGSMAVASRDDSVQLPPGVYQPRGLPPGWQELLDPASGHPYYVGPGGESTWRRPSAVEPA